MEEKVRQGYLYDFYGELLNEHQREIYESFVMEDLSLAEIALAKGISRQAVHDVIRRCTRTLEEYESKLRLMEKFLHIKGSAEEILKLGVPGRRHGCGGDDGTHPRAVNGYFGGALIYGI